MSGIWEKANWYKEHGLIENTPLSMEEARISKLLWHKMRQLVVGAGPQPVFQKPAESYLRQADDRLPEIPPDNDSLPATLVVRNYGGLWDVQMIGEMMFTRSVVAHGRGLTLEDALLDMSKNPDKNYRTLEKAMTKLFKNYPPGVGKPK